MQQAMLWWKTLYAELGTPATKHSDPALAPRARRRASALIGLFDALVGKTGVDVLMEIGAHDARVSVAFTNAASGRRAFAYEASPRIFARNNGPQISKQVRFVNQAIGGRRGEIKFYEPLHDNYESQWGSVKKRKNFDAYKEVTVPMITLADAVDTALEGRVDALKAALWIDVEGYAYEVLASAGAKLAETIAICYVEVNDIAAQENAATSLQLISHMLDNGFVPIARDNEWADAYNVIFLNNKLLSHVQETVIKWQLEEARQISQGN